jgi:ribosomal protein S4E
MKKNQIKTLLESHGFEVDNEKLNALDEQLNNWENGSVLAIKEESEKKYKALMDEKKTLENEKAELALKAVKAESLEKELSIVQKKAYILTKVSNQLSETQINDLILLANSRVNDTTTFEQAIEQVKGYIKPNKYGDVYIPQGSVAGKASDSTPDEKDIINDYKKYLI